MQVKFYLLRRLLGVKTEGDGKAGKVAKLKKGEILMVTWQRANGGHSMSQLHSLVDGYFVNNHVDANSITVAVECIC